MQGTEESARDTAPRSASGEAGTAEPTLAEAAVAVLVTGDARAKAERSRETAARWRAGAIAGIGTVVPPDRPQRPPRPPLLPPREVPRRRVGPGLTGRIALLHALAHIELNAVDLAWDLVARASGAALPRAFFDDWVQVGDEEGKHFLLLDDRLRALGAAYGDLPAHDGLWDAASASADDILARLAIVPLVLEARGLDVSLPMAERLREVGDHASAAILQTIHDEEIGHVRAGRRWFAAVATQRGLEPRAAFHALVRDRFAGLKPPFNHASRTAAGLTADWYTPLQEERPAGSEGARRG